jgi:tetratricopeptide (TPR) repeat protein
MKALSLAAAPGKESLFFATSDSLGQLYLEKGNPRKAISQLEEARSITEGKLTAEQGAILNHDLGTAYKNTGDLDRAKELFEKSLAVNLAGNLVEEAASDHYMIASVHSKQGDYAAADASLQLALQMDKKIENSLGIAKDLNALGLVAAKRMDDKAALDYFKRAYLVYASLGLTADAKKALEKAAAAADALGQADEAASLKKSLKELGN